MQFLVELEEPMYRKMMKAVWNGSGFQVVKLAAIMLLIYVGVRRFWKRRTMSKDDRPATMMPTDGTTDDGGDVSCSAATAVIKGTRGYRRECSDRRKIAVPMAYSCRRRRVRAVDGQDVGHEKTAGGGRTS